MQKKVKNLLLFTTIIIIGLVFLFYGLIKAEKFLIPLTIAVLLAMILLPVEHKLRDWGLSRGLSVLLSDLLLIGFFVGLFFIVGAQIGSIAEDWPQYQKKLQPKIEKVQNFVEKKTGISQKRQEEELIQAFNSEGGGFAGKKIVSRIMSTSGNFLLVFIYVFFFLYYKKKFKNAVLNFVPEHEREKASDVLTNFGKVSQQYLFGRFLLITFLIIIYSSGLAIVGIKHAILVSVIAALLSLIPYLGNAIGIFLALAMSLLSGGGLTMMIGVVIVFTIAQFVESYILEPYIVGGKVDLNPVVTLIGVIIGGYIWGIPGMIIAIPVLGILKVIFDSVPVLNPLGYFLDEKDTGSGQGWMTKMKNKIASKLKN